MKWFELIVLQGNLSSSDFCCGLLIWSVQSGRVIPDNTDGQTSQACFTSCPCRIALLVVVCVEHPAWKHSLPVEFICTCCSSLLMYSHLRENCASDGMQRWQFNHFTGFTKVRATPEVQFCVENVLLLKSRCNHRCNKNNDYGGD